MTKRVLLFLLLSLSISFAQDNSNQSIDFKFKQAVNLFDALQYQRSLNIFESILEKPMNSKTTISFLFKGKALIKLARYNEASEELSQFIKRFPRSNYINEARLSLTNSLYQEKKYYQAFNECLKIISDSPDTFYYNYSKSTAERLGLNYLSSFEISQFEDSLRSNTNQAKSFLLLILGKEYLKEGNVDEARKSFGKLVRNYPSSKESTEAISLNQDIMLNHSSNAPSNIIGVMLPLEGKNVSAQAANSANEILEGIQFAVSEFNKDKTSKDRIGIMVLNTGLDENKIEQIKNEVEFLPQLKAIIGPIFSNEVRKALNVFKNTNIPIISPTATDTGLTNINNNFFQANPPLDLRGKLMAQYIFLSENKTRVAVLNAIDGYSPLLSRSFKEEFVKLGGEIDISETYKSNSFDVVEQVKNIDDTTNIFDAIYIPLADKIDATAILSELAVDSVNTSIYGNQDWLFAKGYETSPDLSNRVVFTSDFYFDYKSFAFQNFSKRFFDQVNRDINRNICYGYDTAEYLLDLLRGSAMGREDIIKKMESGFTSIGYHNNISFNQDRVNCYLNIVKYNNGLFKLITKFKSEN